MEKQDRRTTVDRSAIWAKIYDIVKEIPRENVEGDAMDAPSAAAKLEALFYGLMNQRIDAAYLMGVFNVSGVDGTADELNRLKKLKLLLNLSLRIKLMI